MILVAVHGILTGQTDPSWPDHLDAWVYRHYQGRDIHVIKKEYAAGPFPRWNHLRLNPRIAAGLANEIFLLANERPAPVWLVAHSNGANIALLTAARLIVRGYSVAGMVLTGAACRSDIRRNKVQTWIEARQLGRAVAFCSRADRTLPGIETGSGILARCRSVIWTALAWPYGSLGRTGWTLQGQPFDDPDGRVKTRWFGGGHTGYFSPAQREATFRAITEEMFCGSF